MTTPTDTTAAIIDYENGDLDFDDTVDLFQHLIDTGMAWRLQGHYGRTADDLIRGGHCTLGPTGCNDYYGNYVPAKTELKPGSPGTDEYVTQLPREDHP